jgi:hypothetical protein
MNKINGGVDVLTRPNGQDARPTEWVINIVQLLTGNTFAKTSIPESPENVI